MRRLLAVSALLVTAAVCVTLDTSRAAGVPAIHAVIPTRDAVASQHVLVVLGKSLKRFASFAVRIPDVPDVEIPRESVTAIGGATLVIRVPEDLASLALGSVLLVARNRAGLETTFPVTFTEAAPRIGLFGEGEIQGTGVFGSVDASSGGAGSSATGVLGTATGSDLANVRGVRGVASGALAVGVLGEGNTGVQGKSTVTALRATLTAETGDLAVFEVAGLGVMARIDQDGVGYFDGGVQSSGADFAETVALREGDAPEPGDVLVIDADGDRRFRLSSRASSPAVAGVVSTRPALVGGVLRGADGAATARLAIVGIVPTKVCDEGGPVRRGDLLVSATRPGHAMRAPEQAAPGTVLGKALGDVPEGAATIEVLLQAR